MESGFHFGKRFQVHLWINWKSVGVQGNIVERYEYTPYGVPIPNVGASPNGVGYTGHVNDPETGLVYMQARYYDPAVGRFLSVDPMVSRMVDTFGFNRYVYASNNPIMNIDPVGAADAGEKPTNVSMWMNVTAAPRDHNFSDTVASLGRMRYGTTITLGADTSLLSTSSHGDFPQMMSKIGAMQAIESSYQEKFQK